MPAVLVAVPTVTQNLLHPVSTSSITAHHLLDFMVQGKISEADAMTIPIGGPTYLIPPFLCQIPFLLPASQFRLAWNRLQIMLDCLSSGLVYIRHSAECIMHHTTLKLGQCHYQWAAYTIAKIFTLCTISDFPNFTITFHTNHILECL